MTRQHVNLLVGQRVDSLRDFAELFFKRVLHVSAYEERESSNYIDGYYFRAVSGKRTFQVMLAPRDSHLDLPFWVRIGAVDESESLTDEEIHSLAHALKREGLQVAQIVDYGRAAERRIDYDE